MPEQTISNSTERHLNEEQIERYCARTLSPAETEVVTRHIAGCEICRQRIAGRLPLERSTQQMLETLVTQPVSSEAHLSDETLSAYADNRLPTEEREQAEQHLSRCASCRIEVEQLRSLLQLAEDLPPPNFAPTRSLPFIQRLRDWLEVATGRQGLQLAGAVLVTGVLVFLVTRRSLSPITASNTAETQALQTREVAVSQKEHEAATQRERIEQDQRAIAEKQKTLEQDKRRLEAEKLRLAHAMPPPADLPDPKTLTYVPLPENGITTSVMAGDNEDRLPFALRAPFPGATVLHDRVVFEWDPVWGTPEQGKEESAQSYRVEVQSGSERPIQSPLLKTPWWKPETQNSLQPGRVYSWKVIAYRDPEGHKEIAQAPHRPIKLEFRTLDLSGRKRLQSAGNSARSLGIALAQAGLLADAQHILETYLLATPTDVRAQAWLQHVVKLRADWLRKVDARLQQIPDSTGAKAMQSQIAKQLLER